MLPGDRLCSLLRFAFGVSCGVYRRYLVLRRFRALQVPLGDGGNGTPISYTCLESTDGVDWKGCEVGGVHSTGDGEDSITSSEGRDPASTTSSGTVRDGACPKGLSTPIESSREGQRRLYLNAKRRQHLTLA